MTFLIYIEGNIGAGKSTFVRHLACYLGSCRFCNDLEEATNHLNEVEPRA